MTEQILIVDDEEMVRGVQLATFSRAGFSCLAASGADEACTVLRREEIALALIDINMPGGSGVQLLHELKQISPDTAVVMVTAVDDLQTALACLRMGADDYIVKPFVADRVLLSGANALEKRRLRLENRNYQQSLETKVQAQTEQIRTAMTELQHAYDHTLRALVLSLDAREKETGAHSERVRTYTLHLALAMGVAEQELPAMGKAALLHDLGKIGVSDNILLKPGKLTEEEWVEMKKHAQIGHDIIVEVPFLRDAAEIILSHHERFDGSGYPRGLKGEEIPLGARIFTVVDTLDAMTTDRPYRQALPFAKVTAELHRCRDSQFDPQVVDAFLAIPQNAWEQLARRSFS
ncbi:MAG: response regulator [Desulfuromonadales bacterium]|nr:response regulator [Desulfuromonadales bacterium]